MGRGRAKAKQTKVARQLKYSSPSMDVGSLQRELSGHADDEPNPIERGRWDDYDDESRRA